MSGRILYVTSDRMSVANHGGSAVCTNECAALKELAEEGGFEFYAIDRNAFDCHVRSVGKGHEVWADDDLMLSRISPPINPLDDRKVPVLVHFYAGTFSRSVASLKQRGCKVTYSCDAHDVAVSRREHEKAGIDFVATYPHLGRPELWSRYVAGYQDADWVVCPGKAPANVLTKQGCKRIEIIPHGVDLPLPEKIKPLPEAPPFVVGYLGVCTGPDKGVRYLLEAWKKLAYKDAMLCLGGRDSTQLKPWVEQMGLKDNVVLCGWYKDVADFYSGIHLLVQPAATEGFGIEVLEALAHGRPVLCSSRAGAADLVSGGWTFPCCDVNALAVKINEMKAELTGGNSPIGHLEKIASVIAEQYTWEAIRARYKAFWSRVLAEGT
jgi:glycosyltransferase involved in cell wall biosynthesis